MCVLRSEATLLPERVRNHCEQSTQAFLPWPIHPARHLSDAREPSTHDRTYEESKQEACCPGLSTLSVPFCLLHLSC